MFNGNDIYRDTRERRHHSQEVHLERKSLQMLVHLQAFADRSRNVLHLQHAAGKRNLCRLTVHQSHDKPSGWTNQELRPSNFL